MKALALTIAAALAFAAPASAQMSDSAGAAQWLRGVCPGSREVRIATTAGEQVHGYCDAIERTHLRLSVGSRERTVPLAAVDSVWVRERVAGQGASKGALFGVLLVGGAGVLLGQGFCEGEGDDCIGGSLLLGVGGAAIGGTVGAVLGGIGGHATRTWRRLYPW
jgi:hypothetical protein